MKFFLLPFVYFLKIISFKKNLQTQGKNVNIPLKREKITGFPSWLTIILPVTCTKHLPSSYGNLCCRMSVDLIRIKYWLRILMSKMMFSERSDGIICRRGYLAILLHLHSLFGFSVTLKCTSRSSYPNWSS